MDGEVFFSGLIFGVSVGVVLGYCLPHRLPPREEQQPVDQWSRVADQVVIRRERHELRQDRRDREGAR